MHDTPKRSMWFHRFEQTVAKNLDDKSLSNKKLADFLKISEVHLNRRVKSESGNTPAKYIQDKRMAKAMKLIKSNPDLTEKNISDAVGFIKPSYFTKVFEKYFGRKPCDVVNE